nr:SDR family oxidoreductase [uncultured Comamonas sp.]
MRVLVTGANGFVGRALCPHFLALGHEVVPAVRRSSGIALEHVVHDEASWMAALKGCDSVVHLAARAHVMRDQERNPLLAFRASNVDLTVELATRAVEAGVRRFVFMSTIKVNGEETAPGCSFKPDAVPEPRDAYAISKWEAEQRLLEISQRTGLEVVIIRSPLVYGPGVKGNFASLIKWVKSEIPLPLGAANNCRSMVGLDNLVSFTALCADVEAARSANRQVFLVSDGIDVSTAELLRMVAQAYGCKSRQISVPVVLMRWVAKLMGKSSFADRLLGSLVIDDSKTREVLGWHPPVSMEEQLQKMALYDSLV